MSDILLSILIPITPDRIEVCQHLLHKIGFSFGINHFVQGDIDEWVDKFDDKERQLELVIYCDKKQLTIGEKRERLYGVASGLFSWQIDSDDDIHENAIEKILEAIKSNPEVDCITFREKCIMNGQAKTCNHSLKYFQWMDNQDGYDFIRSPFYKDVIRTDIAKKVPFPHIRWNEDEQWAKALYPHLHTEIHIDEELYIYNYTESNPTEKYGLDK